MSLYDRVGYLFRQDFGFLAAGDRYPFHRSILLRLSLYLGLLVFAVRLFWPTEPARLPHSSTATPAAQVAPPGPSVTEPKTKPGFETPSAQKKGEKKGKDVKNKESIQINEGPLVEPIYEEPGPVRERILDRKEI